MSFASLYSHGFARVAAAVPHMRIGEPGFNAERTVGLAQRASDDHAALVIFPELGLSGYSIDDLLHQTALLDGVVEAIDRIATASAGLRPIMVVGAPLRFEHGIFNCAVVIHGGRVLGVAPKSFLPEYREYYEKRQFRAARDAVGDQVRLLDELVPFGNDLLFGATDLSEFVLHVEVCEDLWVPIPPSTFGALAGATVLANLSASNITIGKAGFRRLLCASQSARTIAAYLYTAAGMGESTTDLAWDGQALIYENGDLLAEAERFAIGEQLILGDVDLDRLVSDRASTSSYGDSIHDHRDRLSAMRRVDVELGVADASPVALSRRVERFPYVPANPVTRNARCEEVYNIQVRGLETRLHATGIDRIVIGVSGGLDSTHALIVAVHAMDRIGLPRSNVLAYTMPGFATTQRTLRNSHRLMDALGVSGQELDIRPAATQMLRDPGIGTIFTLPCTMKSAPDGSTCTTGPSAARCARICLVSETFPSPGAPVTSGTSTLAIRLYRLFGSACWMDVSRAEIFGAASVATCLSVPLDAVDQSCVGYRRSLDLAFVLALRIEHAEHRHHGVVACFGGRDQPPVSSFGHFGERRHFELLQACRQVGRIGLAFRIGQQGVGRDGHYQARRWRLRQHCPRHRDCRGTVPADRRRTRPAATAARGSDAETRITRHPMR